MASPTSVPILSYGRHISVGMGVAEHLAPEYDVVHLCTDFAAALAEIPSILKGDLSVLPATNAGSNVSRLQEDRRRPKAVAFGGGIPDEEIEQIKEATGTDVHVAWIKIKMQDVQAMGGPNPEKLAQRLRKLLHDAGL